MSTRGCIARITGEGKFKGVYHHWDSYPKGGLGETLVEIYRDVFAGDMSRMLATLIDAHPAGWSTINGADWSLPAGYHGETRYHKNQDGSTDYSRPIPYGPVCYCHGERSEEAVTVDEKSDAGTEWTYAFDEASHLMHVLARMYKQKGKHRKAVGMFGTIGRSGTYWQNVGTIDLKSGEVNWDKIECGQAYERCHHYAYYHFPELEDSPSGHLSTGVYIGRDPLNSREHACAVLIGGERYKMTGSGRGDGYTWYATVEDANGTRSDKLIAVRGTGEKFVPAPGVSWVMPPTLIKPTETIISSRKTRVRKAAKLLVHDHSGRKYREVGQ